MNSHIKDFLRMAGLIAGFFPSGHTRVFRSAAASLGQCNEFLPALFKESGKAAPEPAMIDIPDDGVDIDLVPEEQIIEERIADTGESVQYENRLIRHPDYFL